jgi:hypothetical protein
MPEQLMITAKGKEEYRRVTDLLKRTHKANPKEEDVKALRRLLDESPELWRSTGTMARRALDHITRTYFQESVYAQETALRRAEELRAQLGYDNAPPLERLLIEQILVCHLNLYVLEINSAGKLCASHTTEAGLYWDRRLTGAQRRFTRACESLAKIQKLKLPAVQINVAAEGGQQVNVAC